MSQTENAYAHILDLIDEYKADRQSKAEQSLGLAEDFAALQRQSPHRQHFEFNALGYMGAEEPDISKVLGELLRYRDCNGNLPILNLFLSRSLPSLPIDDFAEAQIEMEASNIDISIRGLEHCIIIENKVRDALFQRNQLGRYIMTARQWGYGPKPHKTYW
ncbi:MAG: PD-(D/E)XK nuclease family protein [Bacteroidales bacterium]|nr:PD-(D/E)XK nuclease family protein [Bacteroidales bacterium]